MTTSHTPGQWTAIGTDVKTPGHNSRVICWTGQPEVPLEQARANARLIAAAPDMLAALVAINAALTQPVQFSGTDAPGTSNILRGDCQVAGSIARAAIAKATGGTDR